MKRDEPPIVVEHTFNESLESVWSAITEVSKMRLWFFANIPSFEPRIGFETQFVVHTAHNVFPHLWKITEVIPQQKIVYNWTYDGYSGNSTVTFLLVRKNKQTQLRVMTKVTEDFPDHIPEFKRESCLDGWNYFIKTSLSNYFKSN